MDPKLKKLLASILMEQSGLLEILDEQSGIIHEFTLNEFYAHAQAVDYVADFLGIPHDGTSCMSQKELGEGKCEHGMQFYCRDWIYDAIGEGCKDFPGERELDRFLNFVQSLYDQGEELKGEKFGPCDECTGLNHIAEFFNP